MAKIKHVYGNLLRVAIPLTITIRQLVEGEETEVTSDFYPNQSFPTKVVLRGSGTVRYEYTASIDGNVATFQDKGTVRIGTYQVEVLCFDENANPMRFMQRDAVEVYDATKDAGIVAGVEFEAETHTLDGVVFYYAKGDKGDKGVGIASVEQIVTSDESGGVNIVRVTLTNGEYSDFEVRNGKNVEPTVDAETETLILT